MKLGRKFPTSSKLKLPNYLGPNLPPPPVSKDWTQAMSEAWGVMGNDNLGDCTCAAMGHAVQVITSNGDGLITPPDEEIIKAYEVVGGYVPGDPSTDQGATELDAMRFMVDTGLAGVKVDAFADVNHRDQYQVMQSINIFGLCYIGVLITQEDMDAFKVGQAWNSTSLRHVEGGHALCVAAYDADGITVITWGKAQIASWAWYMAKCDEAHVVLVKNWYQNSVDLSPDGFNQGQLEADIGAL